MEHKDLTRKSKNRKIKRTEKRDDAGVADWGKCLNYDFED